MKKEELIAMGIAPEAAEQVEAALQGKLEAMKQEVKGWKEKYETDMAAVKQEYAAREKEKAIDLAIIQAKGRNPKAIKALLDMENIQLKEDGTLEGLNLEALQKSDSYLFETEEQAAAGTGFEKGYGNQIDTSKMTYTELCEYMAANPDTKI